MDCSQTQDGWFEFTTVYSLGKVLQIFYKGFLKNHSKYSLGIPRVLQIFYKGLLKSK